VHGGKRGPEKKLVLICRKKEGSGLGIPDKAALLSNSCKVGKGKKMRKKWPSPERVSKSDARGWKLHLGGTSQKVVRVTPFTPLDEGGQ